MNTSTETEISQPRSLVSKLAEVMESVGRVPKLGQNSFHGYQYMTEADLVAAVRPELAKRKIIMIPTILSHDRTETVNQKGNKSYFTKVDIEWTVLDGETGEERKFMMPGTAEDTGDKGLYKAITGSEKYALKNLFLVPTGDDPEKDDEGTSNGKGVAGFKPFEKAKAPAAMSEEERQHASGLTAQLKASVAAIAAQEFSGVLESVEQNTDDKGVVWTQGYMDKKRIYTKDPALGNEILRFADCDCTVTAIRGTKANDFRLVSIK